MFILIFRDIKLHLRDLQTRHARAVHFFHPQFTHAHRQRVAGFREAAEFLRHFQLPLAVAMLPSSCSTVPMMSFPIQCNGSVPATSQTFSLTRASSGFFRVELVLDLRRRALPARFPGSRCRSCRHIHQRRRRNAISVRETIAAVFPAVPFRERKSTCARAAADPPPSARLVAQCVEGHLMWTTPGVLSKSPLSQIGKRE